MASVHPRSCGEQLDPDPDPDPDHGSSPLVRGTAGIPTVHESLIRFIPARAGNRRSEQRTADYRTVHPRSCGEQDIDEPMPRVKYGSSPLVRGTDGTIQKKACVSRFIPARAGNSVGGKWIAILEAVHPRSCGEQTSSTYSESLSYLHLEICTNFHRTQNGYS